MEERHITVPRTARYYTLGDARTAKSVWFVLHGYGQLARYFLRAFEGLEKDLLIVAPEGLSRFYTDDGHTRVGATWMTREDRDREIQDQATYLDALADRMKQECPNALHGQVLGFSQGVATAVRWAMNGGTAFSRVVLWGGSLPSEPTAEQWRRALRGTQLTLVQGERDELVPSKVTTEGLERLRSAGLSPERIDHPGAHVLDSLTLTRLLGN